MLTRGLTTATVAMMVTFSTACVQSYLTNDFIEPRLVPGGKRAKKLLSPHFWLLAVAAVLL